MAKQTPRQRLKALRPFLDVSPKSEPVPARKSPPSLEDEKKRRKIAKALLRPLETAFKKEGLDIDKKRHWDQLLIRLAWAVYGPRGPGAPRKWTPKRLRRLLGNVHALRTDNPALTETACCDLLSKGKGAEGRYKDIKSETLRRALQTAKRQDQTAKMLSTPLKEVVTPGSIGSAGNEPS
jgi:hypothetical protein